MKHLEEDISRIMLWGLPENENLKPWIGIDLDGTLASFDYETWARDNSHIGEPVPKILELVKSFLGRGCRVKIFTARICINRVENIRLIQDWLEAAGLPRLEVTNEKDYGMVVLYDDRVRQVEENTGKIYYKTLILKESK